MALVGDGSRYYSNRSNRVIWPLHGLDGSLATAMSDPGDISHGSRILGRPFAIRWAGSAGQMPAVPLSDFHRILRGKRIEYVAAFHDERRSLHHHSTQHQAGSLFVVREIPRTHPLSQRENSAAAAAYIDIHRAAGVRLSPPP